MRPAIVLVFALLALSSCARRYPANAGGDRDAVSGLPVSFGNRAEEVPEGTDITWELGDGASARGATVTHSYARAGEYRVKVTVRDRGEARTSEAVVRVARRPPAAAVPTSARAVFVFDRLFARLSQNLAIVERFAGSERTSSMIHSAESVLGFDPTRPEKLLEAGIDPEEGVALAWLPDDTGMWVVIGTFDERAAMESVRRALSRETEALFTPGPEGSTVATIGDLTFHLLASGGYLYVHFPSRGRDGAPTVPALRNVTRGSTDGLLADPLFAELRRRLPSGDLFAFHRAGELPRDTKLPRILVPFRDHGRAVGLTVSAKESLIDVEALLSLDAEGQKALAQLFDAPHAVDISRRAPAGAAGFLSMSASPLALTSFAADDSAAGGKDFTRAASTFLGMPLEDLLAVLSGDLSLAVYLDVAGLYRDLAARNMPTPKLNAVGAVGVKDAAAAAAALKTVVGSLESRGKLARSKEAGAYEWTIEGQPLGVSLKGKELLAGYGEAFRRAMDDSPETRRMDKLLQGIVPDGILKKPHFLLYADVGSVVDALRNPPPMPDVDAMQLNFLRSMVITILENPDFAGRPLLPVKDAMIEAVPVEGGLFTRMVVHTR